MTFPPFTTGDSGNPFTRSSFPSDFERRVIFAYPYIGVASQPSPSSFSFGSSLGSSQLAQHTAQGPPSGDSTCFPLPPQTSPFLFSSSSSFMPSNAALNTLGYTPTSSFGTVFGSSAASPSPASVFPSFPSSTSAAPAFVSGSNEPGFGKGGFSFGCGTDNTHSHSSLGKISGNSVVGQKPASSLSFSPNLQTNNSANSSHASPLRSNNERPTLANQHRGSRLAPYAVTEMIDEGSAKMVSICGMPVYGEKNHEELRWEDYQLRIEVRVTDGSGAQPQGSNWGESQPFPPHTGFGANSASSPSISLFGQKPTTSFSFSPPLQTNTSVNSSSASLLSSNRGSRIAPYAVTEMVDEGSAKMASIRGMPVYGAKSHEELRREDYQLRTEGCATDGGSTQPWFGTTKGSTSNKSGFFASNMSSTPTWGSNWRVSHPFPPHIGSSADPASIDSFGQKPATSFSFPPPLQINTSGVSGAGSLNWKPNTSFPLPSHVLTPTRPSPFPFDAPNSLHTPTPWLPLPKSSLSAPPNQSPFSEPQPSVEVCPSCHSSLPSPIPFAFPCPQSNPTAAMPATPSANASTFLSNQPSQSAQTESTNPAAVESPATAGNIVAVKDPFGAQPSKQMSTSSTQFGISNMPIPATHIPLLIKTSSLHTPRHISQRRATLRLSVQQQRSDQRKVPFFVHENDPEGIRVTLNHPAPRRDPKSAFTIMSEPTTESSTGTTFEFDPDSTDPNSKMVGKGEFHITLEEEPTAPKLTRPGYYTEPAISELQAKESSEPGFCSRVSGFAIGRYGFGKIEFEGETNVGGLNLDSMVEFSTREVVVYTDPTKKPGVGEGLNKAAVVTLMDVKCVNKKTGEVYVGGEAVEKYAGMLKKAGEKQGAEFVSYDPAKGEWKFRVEHL